MITKLNKEDLHALVKFFETLIAIDEQQKL
jgi:hypothetical protein